MTQGEVQASLRAATGKALDYNGDWHAAFDLAGIAAGDFNGRLLAWINAKLGTSYNNLPGAQAAFAAANGAKSWSSLGTFDAAVASAPTISARYWRLKITTWNGYPSIAEIEFYKLGSTKYTPTGTMSSSNHSEIGAGGHANAFDGNVNTSWYPANAVAGEWIGCDLGSAKDVNSVRIRARGSGQYPVNVTVEKSSDGSAWTTAWSIVNIPQESQSITMPFPMPSAADKAVWKFFFANGNGSTAVALGEVELRATVGGADLTGNAITQIYANSEGTAADLVDNNTLTHAAWATSGVAHFEFPASQNLAQMAVTNRNGFPDQAPKSGDLYYSADGTNWTPGISFTNATGWGTNETRLFS